MTWRGKRCSKMIKMNKPPEKSKLPPDKPGFLCGICQDVLCDDCASTAAEYEFLFESRTNALWNANYRIDQLKIQVGALQREVRMWEAVAKAGLPVIVQAWMDDQVKKAQQAGRRAAREEARKSGILKKLADAEKLIARANQIIKSEGTR